MTRKYAEILAERVRAELGIHLYAKDVNKLLNVIVEVEAMMMKKIMEAENCDDN